MSLLSRNRASISVTSVGHVNILAPPNKAVQFPPKAVCARAFSPFHFENDITYCPSGEDACQLLSFSEQRLFANAFVLGKYPYS